MKLVHGKVVAGKIEFEGEPLKEGSSVTILARDDGEETFELSPRDEAELTRRIEQMQQGHYVDGDEFLGELSRG